MAKKTHSSNHQPSEHPDEDQKTCTGSLKQDFKHTFIHLFQEIVRQLRLKKAKHWAILAVLVVGGTVVGHILGEQNFLIDWRYKLYQWTTQWPSPRHPHPKRTALVLIGDEEYWNGPFERRVPLKRDLLAKLLRRVSEANPAVIALDVRMNSPMPEKTSEELPVYQEETKALLDAIREISVDHTVVLAKEVNEAEEERAAYVVRPTVYDNFPFAEGKVRKGFISLPYDLRRVPLALSLKDESRLDSFASAIVRSIDEKSLEEAQGQQNNALPYGTFIYPQDFPVRSAEYVFNSDIETLKRDFACKVVIVGGGWHRDAFRVGPMNDGHQTPVGEVYGAFVHANYVEALLDSRTYRPMSGRVATTIEVVLSVLLALFISLDIRLRLKLLAAALLCGGVFLISYVSWQNLGMFFDFFIPVVLLIGHIFAEKIFS